MFIFNVAVVGAGPAATEVAERIEAAGLAVERREGEDYAGLGEVDLAIELGPESLEAKQAAFAALDACTPGHAVLASGGAGPSITEIADATSRPDKVVGLCLHGDKRLVEVVEGDETSPETAQAAVNFVQAIRRTPVRCAESPGAVVERIVEAAGDDELQALAEACRVVEEGVAGVRDVDLAMRLGADMRQGPFARADERGLDEALSDLDGDAPRLLRRLVAQGRLGAKSGQGFYPHPQPDEGFEDALVKLETRGEIAVAWLDNPPANAISPALVDALRTAWKAIEASGARVMVLASADPGRFSAGADILSFSKLGPAGVDRELIRPVGNLLRAWERSRVATVACVNGLALGGGCELALGCDVRLASHSASFGQPEVKLGLIPGFGGTQRLVRLIGETRALELNLIGEAIAAEDACAYGLVNRVFEDHELFEQALGWARKLAAQAPVAIAQIKRATGAAAGEGGLEAEREGFATAFASDDAHEGIAAFREKRRARWSGQ